MREIFVLIFSTLIQVSLFVSFQSRSNVWISTNPLSIIIYIIIYHYLQYRFLFCFCSVFCWIFLAVWSAGAAGDIRSSAWFVSGPSSLHVFSENPLVHFCSMSSSIIFHTVSFVVIHLPVWYFYICLEIIQSGLHNQNCDRWPEWSMEGIMGFPSFPHDFLPRFFLFRPPGCWKQLWSLGLPAEILGFGFGARCSQRLACRLLATANWGDGDGGDWHLSGQGRILIMIYVIKLVIY